MKIAHAADIHIRGVKYLDEMRYTFDRFYEALDEESYDLIVLCGDIFHSKLTVSSEYFDIAVDFLSTLKKKSSVIVIPGNHDLALNNKRRLDAISPVVKAVNLSSGYDLLYSKYSESFFPSLKGFIDPGVSAPCRPNELFNFHHFSILDKKEDWRKGETLDKSKVNIALYHGSINGAKFDNGWVSRGNKDDIGIFKGYDFALLGDIHICQFFNGKRVAYPGSLRQNNYGESIDKGFLKWEIEGKDDFEVERVVLPQKRYFFTLYGSTVEDVKDIGDLAENSRIRFQLTEDAGISEQLKIKSEIEKLYSPINDVGIIPPKTGVDIGSIKVGSVDVLHENIREPEVQKELIKEYFKDKNISEEDLIEVRNLDKVYHSHIETDVERNVVYRPKSMSWKNLFAYGERNSIDFSKLKGLVGLFGDNAIGKSSIMDIVSLVLTNQVHKEGATKNVDYINRRAKKSNVEIKISMNNKDYRVFKSYEKKVGKNGETCISDVDFEELAKPENLSLNGEKKPDTNAKIRKKFGTYEDLDFTSLCPQFRLTSFIDSRATKRKETLAKYFDLDIYSTKFNLAKRDYDELKSKLEDYDYTKITSEIELKKIELDSVRVALQDKNSEKNRLIEESGSEEEALRNLFMQRKNVEYDHKDLDSAMIEKDKIETEISESVELISILEKNIGDFSGVSTSLADFIQEEKEINSKIVQLEHEMLANDKLRKLNLKTSELLKKIPNVPQCQVCPLAHHAYEAKDEIPEIENQYTLKRNKLEELKKQYKEKSYNSVIDAWKKSDRSEKEIERIKKDLVLAEKSLGAINKLIGTISKNLDDIIINKEIMKKIEDKEAFIKDVKSRLNSIDNEIISLTSNVSVLEFSIKSLEDRLEKCEELNNEKYIYDLYLDAMGKNGISYWIISKKMPIINKQVNFILSHAVNFKLFIEDSAEEKKVKIYIVDEKGKRPIELGSGMEKTVSAIALRAALWNICLLPKMPMLMLDEAFSHLDNEKYDSVIKLLSYLKGDFDTIFIITHDQGLKSVVDQAFYIEKDEKGMAKCRIS